MGSIRRDPRNPKLYQARYRTPDGKQRSKNGFANKADAKAYLSIVEVDVIRDEWIAPELGKVTFAEWHEQWWATTVDLRASTRARDHSYITNHLLPAFEDRKLSDITQLEVRRWVAALAGKGLAPATVVKCHQILGKILGAAVDAGMIVRSPAANVPLPKIETHEMRIITPTEIALLADRIAPRYRAMVLVASYAGLRLGELGGLRWKHVDLLGRTLRVAEINVEVSGHLTFGPPKTKAGRRTVPLSGVAVEALEKHFATYGGDDDELVFTAPEGGPLRAPQWRARHWAKAVSAAGLAPLRPHDMRHTAVSLWIAAGASAKQVATWAGHTSVSVVLDRYGHLFPGHEQPVLDRLDELAGLGD